MLTNLAVLNGSQLPCEDEENFYDDCPFIWNHYKKAGYRTLLGEDEKLLGIFNWDQKGFQKQPTDYYLRPFSVAAEKLIGHERRLFTNLCYGRRPAFQVLLDYMQKMTIVMGRTETEKKKQPYFQFAWSSSVTHDIENGAQLMDDMLRDAMHWWNSHGYLNNTVFILMSDHGVRWGDIHNHFQGKLEDRLPLMYFVLPKWFEGKYPKAYQNLRGNRERLITTVDLYQTLVNIIELDMNNNYGEEDDDTFYESLLNEKDEGELFTGISLFSPVSNDRTCKMAGIPEAYCTCNHEIRELSVTDKLTVVAAEFALDALNTLITVDFEERCAELELLRVLKIAQVSFGKDVKQDGTWEGYQLSFTTVPGNGRFDAFLMWDGDRNWTMSGVIERTNSYGNQSHCVEDKMVKLYCYCLDLIGWSENGQK